MNPLASRLAVILSELKFAWSEFSRSEMKPNGQPTLICESIRVLFEIDLSEG